LTTLTPQKCRTTGCAESVPPPLRGESLCAQHFLERAFDAAQNLLELFQRPQPLDWRALEWLFSDAAYAANQLTLEADRLSEAQKDRLLQLMLCLANLHEYLRHHSVPLKPAD
jgi:hypothetical protein